MAEYKVPQDVEADDKLIGPFSFRQFIYLIIVAAAIALGWGLAQIFVGLAVIVLPVVIFFGALALPLRKDQPMETYLAAIVSFYLKPRKRLWDPDGIQQLIEITAPRVVEVQRTKDITGAEADKRFSYLANIVDSQGWAVRGVANPIAPDTAMQTDLYFEAQQTEDLFDENSREAANISGRLNQSATKRKEELVARLQQPAPTEQPLASYTPMPQSNGVVIQPPSSPMSAPVAAPQPPMAPQQQQPMPQDNPNPQLTINPYPASMHQMVIQPVGAQSAPSPQQQPAPTPQVAESSPSETPPSPAIISLANNSDLSVETIAHEASRIKEKELADDEVVISLR